MHARTRAHALRYSRRTDAHSRYTSYLRFQVVDDDPDGTDRKQLAEVRSLAARGYPLAVEEASLSLLALRTALDTVAYGVNQTFFDSTLVWSNAPALRRKLQRVTGVVEGWTHFNVTLGVADSLAELSEKSGASMDATVTGFEVGTNYSFGLQR